MLHHSFYKTRSTGVCTQTHKKTRQKQNTDMNREKLNLTNLQISVSISYHDKYTNNTTVAHYHKC